MHYYKLMNLFELGLCERYEFKIKDLDGVTYDALYQYQLRYYYPYSTARHALGEQKLVVFIHSDYSRLEFFCNTVGELPQDEDVPIGLVGLDCYHDSMNFRLIHLVQAILQLINKPELLI